jgi:hypothetical protein
LDPAAELERQLDQKLDRTAPASIGAHPRRVPVQAIIAVAIAATALALAFWILL